MIVPSFYFFILLCFLSIDAEKITIETDGSRIILKGKIRSITEREEAEKAAWSAPGVTSVENELVVAEEEFAF